MPATPTRRVRLIAFSVPASLGPQSDGLYVPFLGPRLDHPGLFALIR